jgi:hypothetical protein
MALMMIKMAVMIAVTVTSATTMAATRILIVDSDHSHSMNALSLAGGGACIYKDA